MKAFVLDPLWSSLITPKLESEIKKADIEIVLSESPQSLKNVPQLFEGTEERILCINPDYVGWSVKAVDYKDIPNLKAVLIQSTSFGYIEPVKDIPICNIKNFSTQAVAEWAILMALNLARQTPIIIKNNFKLDYSVVGMELKGKKAGVVGMGNNGRAIAERCKALGMSVIYWSTKTRLEEYQYKELKDVFKEADFIFPAVADNEETKRLITDEMLKSMKKKSVFVSIVHHIYNHSLLLNMVKQGKIFGYGFEGDPEKFKDFDGNIWAAPAYAWCTDGSMNKAMELWVENMISASKGEFPNKVA